MFETQTQSDDNKSFLVGQIIETPYQRNNKKLIKSAHDAIKNLKLITPH